MGVHQSAVGRWEEGETVPSDEHAKKLEEVTGGAVSAVGWAK